VRRNNAISFSARAMANNFIKLQNHTNFRRKLHGRTKHHWTKHRAREGHKCKCTACNLRSNLMLQQSDSLGLINCSLDRCHYFYQKYRHNISVRCALTTMRPTVNFSFLWTIGHVWNVIRSKDIRVIHVLLKWNIWSDAILSARRPNMQNVLKQNGESTISMLF